jgi:hypothetical protein
MSLLLGRTELKVRLNMVGAFAEAFGATLQRCRSNLVVSCGLLETSTTVNILPVLLSVAEAPDLTIEFERVDNPSGRCEDCLNDSELQQLSKLVDLSHSNTSWRQYLRSAALETLTLHYPHSWRDHVFYEKHKDAWLQVTLSKDYRKLWMEGTHSFSELEEFLADTGLVGLNTMDVRVGLTWMKNKGSGKGLRTKEEQKTIDWLLNQSKKTPNEVKGPPRILEELEDDCGRQA